VKGAPPSRQASSRWARAIDPLIALGLFVGYLAALLLTAKGLGYARDEGFYFHAAGTYGKWFELLLSNPSRALQPATVDRFWQENHEHPALMKSLFWLSQRLFDRTVFSESGTALRFPAMVLSSLAVSVTFALGRRCIGRGAGVVAALSFALMPQIFYHSHLAAFDMPIAALWLFVVYAYHRSLKPGALGWAVLCAVLYGLALDTKHNSWLLPPALVAHALWLAAWRLLQRRRARRSESTATPSTAAHLTASVPAPAPAPVPAPAPRERWLVRFSRWFPLAFISMPLLAPPLMYALWPWIWRDTLRRLIEYIQFHRQHVYYNMEYLGRTYFEPPFPRSYSWLMTLATVPAITLVLALCGGLYACVAIGRSARARVPLGDAAATAFVASDAAASATTPDRNALDDPRSIHNWASLCLACIVASYFVWLFDDTPIFGGTKHWISAYPFIALFAGQGFAWLTSLLARSRAGARGPLRRAAPWALGLCTLVGPFAMTWSSHPWGLTAYTPLVGGAPGAATLGLNRSFWGYTTGAVVDFLNERVGRGERVFLHDTTADSFHMLQKDGRLRGDIRPSAIVAGSKFALYHHEQHMSRVEYMVWVDYGTTAPAHVATFDGVPMIWVYERPTAAPRPPAPAASVTPSAPPEAAAAEPAPVETPEPAPPEPAPRQPTPGEPTPP
jgi:dolichyl-phosphate-mannose-protein mannosyltransferase